MSVAEQPREEAMEVMEEEETTKEADNVPWAWFKKMQHIVESPPANAAPAQLPLEILPWLYISDLSNLRDTKRLVEMGITHVLSVNAMQPTRLADLSDRLRTEQIVHQHVPGRDEYGYDMIEQHWATCFQFLESVFVQYKANNASQKKVVVHCLAGINRSGLIVAAAHMVLTRTPVLEVVRNLVHQRGSVLWNRSFQMQLCVLAAREGLLGEHPVGYSNDPSTEDDDDRPTEDDDDDGTKVVECIVRSLSSVKFRSHHLPSGTESSYADARRKKKMTTGPTLAKQVSAFRCDLKKMKWTRRGRKRPHISTNKCCTGMSSFLFCLFRVLLTFFYRIISFCECSLSTISSSKPPARANAADDDDEKMAG
jgi:predicted protein tyrosine phosphatase